MKLSTYLGLAALAVAFAACTAPGPTVTPAQNLVNVTAKSCQGLGDGMRATDAAVLNGLLKKPQAEQALKAFTAAQASCVSALTVIQAAQPAASGVAP